MPSDLVLDYEVIASARDAIVRASEAVDMRALRGLESTPSSDLRRARDAASEYASGALALVALDLVRISRELAAVELAFRELDTGARGNPSPAKLRDPV